jgi:hypothetical protein
MTEAMTAPLQPPSKSEKRLRRRRKTRLKEKAGQRSKMNHSLQSNRQARSEGNRRRRKRKKKHSSGGRLMQMAMAPRSGQPWSTMVFFSLLRMNVFPKP